MLEIIKIKYNIGLNRLAGIKTENNIILLDFIILWKLLRIFMLVILINCNLKQKKIKKKNLLKGPCI